MSKEEGIKYTEEDLKKPLYVPKPISEEHKIEMVQGYFHNAEWIPIQTEDHLRNQPMVQMLITEAIMKKYRLENNFVIWGHGTLSRSVNGYPMCSECRLVTREDHNDLVERIQKAEAAMDGKK